MGITEKIGEILGFAIMYLIFTTILYFILDFFEKLPSNWNYFTLAMATLFLVLIGILIKMWLEN